MIFMARFLSKTMEYLYIYISIVVLDYSKILELDKIQTIFYHQITQQQIKEDQVQNVSS